MRKFKNYSIGLDIGTNSVGWAVINPETYTIMKKGSTNLWGVRLFEAGESAAERRVDRSNRRRFDRRRERIRLLRKEFENSISVVDSNFFTKLDESKYWEEDKSVLLTKSEKAYVKEYYKKYPTIYHLRNALVNNKEKEDIRLVYLALHNLIKYRGNFLLNNESFNLDNLNIAGKLEEIFTYYDCEFLEKSFYKNLEKSILNPDSKILITNELKNIFNKSFVDEFCKLIKGYKFSPTKLLSIESDSKFTISFKGSDFEDKTEELSSLLGDNFEILSLYKELFDMVYLKQTFGKNDILSISQLMIYKFDKYKIDMKRLKNHVGNDNKDVYYKIFKDKKNKSKVELCLLSKYIKNEITNEEFIKELEKLVDDFNFGEDFMPRISDKDNGKFPYQLNKSEIESVIENQGKYYPFLLDKIDGKYKIVRLLEFRIPYYVGPLNTTTHKKGVENKNAWICKKKDEKITAYNFDEVVDKDASAEKFIERMISHCTYLLNKKVMANQSIFYSKFKVLNELKQIRVNDDFLSKDLQMKIYKELFLKTNTVNEKTFINYLRTTGEFNMEEITVKGYSDEKKFANNMKSYIDFFGANGIFTSTNYTENDAENIIRYVTIFEDKTILKTKIKREFTQLNEETINRILSLKYTGWGSLSKALLTDVLYFDNNTNTSKSIMDLMIETNSNFMQILFNKAYKFQEKIDNFNNIADIKTLDYSVVADLYASPATKKGIYQALKIVEEIVKVMGKEPLNISVEMAREENKKIRTVNRKNQIEALYLKNKNLIDNYTQLKKELGQFEDLSNQKFYLYFLQQGKDLYTGKAININDLEAYDIDHILPQSLIKDDSIDNKALVLKVKNTEKGARYILPREFQTPCTIALWKNLVNCKLMSAKKLSRLMRNRDHKKEELSGFIERQIVETRQICKHVANVLNSFYKNTNIIYLHANLSHNFRDKYDFYKFRDINNFHHAQDAYLSAVLGEYKLIFDKNKKLNEDINLVNQNLFTQKDFKKLKYGYFINSLELPYIANELGEVIFEGDKFIQTVTNNIQKNKMLITKKTEIRTGAYYNETKLKKGSKGLRLKDNLPTEKYGSYSSVNPSYAVLVEFTKKNKEHTLLVGMPIAIVQKSKGNKHVEIEYLKSLLNLEKEDALKIICNKIPFNSLLNWEGQICYLVGASDKVEVINAKEFSFDVESMKKWSVTLDDLFKNKKIKNENYENELVEIIIYIINKIEKEYNLYLNLVEQIKSLVNYPTLENITLENKETFIKEIFKLLKTNSGTANFKTINSNYSGYFGKKHSRIITNAYIINPSITGVYTNFVKMKKD